MIYLQFPFDDRIIHDIVSIMDNHTNVEKLCTLCENVKLGIFYLIVYTISCTNNIEVFSEFTLDSGITYKNTLHNENNNIIWIVLSSYFYNISTDQLQENKHMIYTQNMIHVSTPSSILYTRKKGCVYDVYQNNQYKMTIDSPSLYYVENRDNSYTSIITKKNIYWINIDVPGICLYFSLSRTLPNTTTRIVPFGPTDFLLLYNCRIYRMNLHNVPEIIHE
jgi:hypothetical protein